MKNIFFKAFLILSFFLVTANVQAQQLKFDEVLTCFSAPEFPVCLFDMADAKGFERIDKEYFENCDRIVYFYAKGSKPTMFIIPMLCRKPMVSEQYPVRIKNELELQFQKSSRALFESINYQVRKQCKPLPDENGTIPGPKSKTTKRAYRHEATGVTIVVSAAAPVAYIYFLK